MILNILAVALAGASFSQDPPAFEFREVTSALTQQAATSAGLVYRNRGALEFCRRSQVADHPITQCPATEALTAAGVAGQRIQGLNLGFDADGLALFMMTVEGVSVPAVSSAFTAKFGPPCQEETRVWANAMGAELANPVVSWCLSDGRLELHAVSASDYRLGQAIFVPTRLQAPVAPAVDF